MAQYELYDDLNFLKHIIGHVNTACKSSKYENPAPRRPDPGLSFHHGKDGDIALRKV